MPEFIEHLKNKIETEARLLTYLKASTDADYGNDQEVSYIGWKPDPYNLDKNVPIDKRIVFRLKDKMSGVDIDSVWVKINGVKYQKEDPGFKSMGARREYVISVCPGENWDYGQEVNVEVYAEDLAGNPGLLVEIL